PGIVLPSNQHPQIRQYRTGVVACVYGNWSSAWREPYLLAPLRAPQRRRQIGGGGGATATPLPLAAAATATLRLPAMATPAMRPAPTATTARHLPYTPAHGRTGA